MTSDPLEPHRKIEDKLNQISGSMCLCKWKHTTLHLLNGHTQSCHHVKTHKIPLRAAKRNPSVLHNTPFKKKMRKQMLKGVRPKECQYCWNIEDVGKISDRSFKSGESWALDDFDGVIQARHRKNINPGYLEISFESTCNFKCMYCSPQFSSKWAEEIKEFGPYPVWDQSNSLTMLKLKGRMPYSPKEKNPYIDIFWDWWPDLVKDLKVFRITGGEPLLSREVWRVLDFLIENPQKDLNFAINSNLGLADPLIDKFQEKINALEGKIKSLTIYPSIDTVGEQAEYIRTGLDFDRFFNNTEKLLNNTPYPITFNYMVVINALSLPGFKNLVELIHEQKKKFPQHHVHFDAPYLRNPPHMCINILPIEFSKYLQDVLGFMKETYGKPGGYFPSDVERLDRVLKWMKESPLQEDLKTKFRRDFYKMFTEYDRRRGTDFYATFPEYHDFMKLCSEL